MQIFFEGVYISYFFYMNWQGVPYLYSVAKEGISEVVGPETGQTIPAMRSESGASVPTASETCHQLLQGARSILIYYLLE